MANSGIAVGERTPVILDRRLTQPAASTSPPEIASHMEGQRMKLVHELLLESRRLAAS